MAVIRLFICLLPFWKQAKSVGHFGQLKKPDKLVADSQIFDLQLARVDGPMARCRESRVKRLAQ